jgi:hypothetical protein
MTVPQSPSPWRKHLKTVFAGVGIFVVACCVLGLVVSRMGNQDAAQIPPAATASPATAGATTDEPTTDSGATAPEPTIEPTVVPPTPELTVTPEPVVLAEGASRQNPAPLNTEFRGKTWAFAITNVIRGSEANALIAEANMFNDAPAEGFEYVLATVKVTNIATEDKAENVMLATYIRLTGSRNQLYNMANVVEPTQLEGDVFPNGSVEGQIAFEVPSDETNLMFVLNEAFAFGPALYVEYDAGASMVPDSSIAMTDTQIGLSRDTPAKFDDMLVINPVAFRIDQIVRGADAAKMVEDANQFNDPPAEGMEYVCIKITLKYLGDGQPDSTYSTALASNEFRLIGSQNVLYDVPTVVEPLPQFSDMDANSVYAGGVISGWIVREVPAGESRLLLQYQPQFDFFDTSMRYIALP